MSREENKSCASGACASGSCARSSGWPLMIVAAALAALWAATGNSGWLALAALSALSAALWWLAARWANGRACDAC